VALQIIASMSVDGNINDLCTKQPFETNRSARAVRITTPIEAQDLRAHSELAATASFNKHNAASYEYRLHTLTGLAKRYHKQYICVGTCPAISNNEQYEADPQVTKSKRSAASSAILAALTTKSAVGKNAQV